MKTGRVVTQGVIAGLITGAISGLLLLLLEAIPIIALHMSLTSPTCFAMMCLAGPILWLLFFMIIFMIIVATPFLAGIYAVKRILPFTEETELTGSALMAGFLAGALTGITGSAVQAILPVLLTNNVLSLLFPIQMAAAVIAMRSLMSLIFGSIFGPVGGIVGAIFLKPKEEAEGKRHASTRARARSRKKT